jgi:hypothetical protein
MRDKPSVFAFYKGVYIKPGTAATARMPTATLLLFHIFLLCCPIPLSVILFSRLFPPFFFPVVLWFWGTLKFLCFFIISHCRRVVVLQQIQAPADLPKQASSPPTWSSAKQNIILITTTIMVPRVFYADLVSAYLQGHNEAALFGNDMLDNNMSEELQPMHEEHPKDTWARFMQATQRANPLIKRSPLQVASSKAAHKLV